MKMRVVAGTLLLVSFAAIIGNVLLFLQEMNQLPEAPGSPMDVLAPIGLCVAITHVAMSIVVLVGGISAMLGKNLALAIAGAIVGSITGGYLFLGSLCAIAAMFLLAVGEREFESERGRGDVPFPGRPTMPPHTTGQLPRLVIYPHPHSPSCPRPSDLEGRMD